MLVRLVVSAVTPEKVKKRSRVNSSTVLPKILAARRAAKGPQIGQTCQGFVVCASHPAFEGGQGLSTQSSAGGIVLYMSQLILSASP